MKHNCSNCGKPTRSHDVDGQLFCHDCVVTDGGGEGEAKQQKWLYKTPRPDEFRKFDQLLRDGMPDHYTPHYFKIKPGSKAPKGGISWKSERGRMTTEEAIRWMENGGNVGIAGMKDDSLVNQDIDGGRAPSIYDVKPTLTVRSRSREPETGHNFYRGVEGSGILNINTADSGEIRCDGEYVVAAGSYVPPDPVEDVPDDESLDEAFPDGVFEADVPDDDVEDAGYYTVEIENAVSDITLRELPRVFIEQVAWSEYRERKRDQEKRQGKDPDTVPAGDQQSAVFDIKVRNIVSSEGGSTDPTDRWTAMFHKSSTDANMSVSDEGLLHCWRHGTTHNGLQTLAVLSDQGPNRGYGCNEIGAGHNNTANGPCSLSTGELVWAAWKHAKEKGYIANDDPIPSKALVHVAKKDGVVKPAEIIDGWKIAGGKYGTALDHVEEEYGLDPGRTGFGGGPGKVGANLAAILPSVRDESRPTNTPMSELQNRTYDAITSTIVAEENVCIDGIMSSGKSYGAFKAAAELERDISVFVKRDEMKEEAKENAIENGIPEDDILVLPSFPKECPTMNGAHGKEWKNLFWEQYNAGATPKAIHSMNDDVPCRDHSDNDDHDDGKCPYEAMWDFDPDEYQVIIGHQTHSHVTHVTMGRVCVFDEAPESNFVTRLGEGELIPSINTFLSTEVSPPLDDFNDLIESRNDEKKVKECSRWFNRMEQQDEIDLGSPDSRCVVEHVDGKGVNSYNAYAALAVYVILNSSPVAEGSDFERSFLPGKIGGGLFFTTSEQRGEYYCEFLESPGLHYASSVIALDGTPLVDESRDDPHQVREWSQALGIPLHHRRILTDSERQDYIQNTLGHRYVSASDYVNPYSSGKYNDMAEDAALLAAVKQVYGNGENAPVTFTPKAVEDEYRDAGFVERGLASDINHPGNLRGTNKYADERLLVILGSTHHGDHEIRRRAAWLREDVSVEGKGSDRDYGSDIGNAILRQMRENVTGQMAMRVGRDGGGATIVLKTTAHPDYLPVVGKGGVTKWPDGVKQVREAWSDLVPDGASFVEVEEVAEHPAVNVSTRQVRNALQRFVELGYIKKGQHPTDGRKNAYTDDGLRAVEEHEEAEIELPELEWPDDMEAAVPETVRTNVFTSDFRTSPPDVAESADLTEGSGPADVTGGNGGGGTAHDAS